MAWRNVDVALRADIRQYQQGMATAAKSTRDLATEAGKVGPAATKAGASAADGAGRAARAADQAAQSSRKWRADLEDVSRTGLIIGGGMLAGFGLATRATMGFDKAMSEVGATSGATGAELEKLRQAALQAGADTAFSAGEAAQAQAELAKAGVGTADILGGALTGALSLAAAGGLDLATAAEIAAQTMTTFGLAGSDVGRIADALAAGANKSAADVSQLSQGLSQAGLVANQYGLTMEETVGTLSLFSQNALNGSDAGTSLKTMLMRLGAPTKEASDLMEQLGIRVYDAQGGLLDFDDIAGSLQTSLSGLTDAQKNAALATLFGSDAIRAANIVVEAGAEGVRHWTEEVSAQGYAADLAAKKLDNLSGDVEAFMGSVETALIRGGSTATGTLRGITQWATGAVNAFAALPQPVQASGMALLGVGGSATLLLSTIGSLVPKIVAAKESLEGLGSGGMFASGALTGFAKAGAYGIGMLGFAVGAQAALDVIARMTGDEVDIGRLTSDLLELGESAEVTGELASKFGEDLEGLVDKVKYTTDLSAYDQFNTATSTTFKHARDDVQSLDDALADMVRAGYPDQAAESFRELQRVLLDNGVSQERVNEAFGDYREASTEARAAADLQRKTTESGTTAVEEFTAAVDDAEASQAAWAETIRSSSDPFGVYTDALARKNEAERKAYEATKQAAIDSGKVWEEEFTPTATLSLHEFTESLIAENLRLMRWQQDIATIARRAGTDVAIMFAEKGLDYAEVAHDAATASVDELRTMAQAMRDNAGLAGEGTVQAFESTFSALPAVAGAGSFATADAIERNMNGIPGQVDRVGQDIVYSVGSRLGEAGVAGGSGAFVAANAIDSNFNPTPGVDATGVEMVGAIRNRLIEANVAGGSGAASAGSSIAGRFGEARPWLQLTALGYAQDIAGGVNPVLSAIGHSTVHIAAIARGGAFEDHAPQIAPGGAWRLWAEPETGGEAYIPRLGDPRRARAILNTAADWYGMAVLPKDRVPPGLEVRRFAAGGTTGDTFEDNARQHPWQPGYVQAEDGSWVPPSFYSGRPPGYTANIGDAPAMFLSRDQLPPVPSFDPFRWPIQYGARDAAGYMRDAVGDWLAQTLATSAFAGGGDAGGLNPITLAKFNLWNALTGGYHSIVSGYRSYAEQAALYARFIAGDPSLTLVAPPGQSNHQLGLAIDHSPGSTPSTRAIGYNIGAHWPVPAEDWHFEVVGMPRGFTSYRYAEGGFFGADQVPVKVLDKGGWLDPHSVTMAVNNLGHPEPVGGPLVSMTMVVKGNVYADDLAEKVGRGLAQAGQRIKKQLATTRT